MWAVRRQAGCSGGATGTEAPARGRRVQRTSVVNKRSTAPSLDACLDGVHKCSQASGRHLSSPRRVCVFSAPASAEKLVSRSLCTVQSAIPVACCNLTRPVVCGRISMQPGRVWAQGQSGREPVPGPWTIFGSDRRSAGGTSLTCSSSRYYG
jgi:hypothetical protein